MEINENLKKKLKIPKNQKNPKNGSAERQEAREPEPEPVTGTGMNRNRHEPAPA